MLLRILYSTHLILYTLSVIFPKYKDKKNKFIRRRQREERYYTAAKNKCPVSHNICEQHVCHHLFYPNLAHYLEILNLFENLLPRAV